MIRRTLLGLALTGPMFTFPAFGGTTFRRLSARPGDPGLPAFELLCAHGLRVMPYLDGVPQPNAETVDLDKGFVIRAQSDEQGNLIVRDDAVALEKLHGRVELRFFGG